MRDSKLPPSRGKPCFFCGEKATVVMEEHHEISKRILRRIPKFILHEVLHEIFSSRGVQLYPLCRNCHKKLHSVLRPFEKCILIFYDLESTEKATIRRKMKEKILRVINRLGDEDYAEMEVILAELEKNGLGREESLELLKELRMDGPIYFVLPEEASARHDPTFVNKITYTHLSDYKGRSKKERT